MSEILKIEKLHKSFEGVLRVKDVSFVARQHDIVLITGENGAGKTTLFNLITGLEKPDGGKIIFSGSDITSTQALNISRSGLVRLYQHPRLFKNLPVWENLVAAAPDRHGNSFIKLLFKARSEKQHDRELKQKAVSLLEKFSLIDLQNRIAGELSYGQQKLISFCMIIMNAARLVLLDEPFAGLNPQTIEQFCKMIPEMKSQGVTFLIIEHNVNKALAIADRHLEMNNGLITEIKENLAA